MCVLLSPAPDLGSRKAIARVDLLGGLVGFDEERPDRPVVRIAFNRENAVVDDDLAELEAFPELRHLVVLSDRVTDAGLEHLRSSTCLRWLAVYSRSITMRGLLRLATHLDALEGMSIRRAPITADEKAAFSKALPWIKWR